MKKQTGLMLLVALVSLNVKAQHKVGSGGDYIRQVFEQARTLMAEKTGALNACSFDKVNIKSETKNWILKNKEILKQDIEQSEHLWVVDTQATCAYTIHSSNAPIYLSYATCNNLTTELPAASFTLVHESAHHLAIADEREADLIAKAITEAEVVEKCEPKPLVQEPAVVNFDSVFEPEICQGPAVDITDLKKYFTPGKLSATAGSYKFYARSRFCYTISGCTDWSSNEVMVSTSENPYSAVNYSDLPRPMQIQSSTMQPYFRIIFFDFQSYGYEESIHMEYRIAAGKIVLDYGSKISIYLKNNLSTGYKQRLVPLEAFKYTGGSKSHEFAGAVRQTCGWFKKTSRLRTEQIAESETFADGYQENEIVYYGTH